MGETFGTFFMGFLIGAICCFFTAGLWLFHGGINFGLREAQACSPGVFVKYLDNHRVLCGSSSHDISSPKKTWVSEMKENYER